MTLARQKKIIKKKVVAAEHSKTLKRVELLMKISQGNDKPEKLVLEASELAMAFIDDYEKWLADYLKPINKITKTRMKH